MKILLSFRWFLYFMVGFLLISLGSETDYKEVCIFIGAIIIRTSAYFEGQDYILNKNKKK